VAVAACSPGSQESLRSEAVLEIPLRKGLARATMSRPEESRKAVALEVMSAMGG